MLNCFCANKTAYHKGQIFPFMLAVVAVLVIMFMITFNLGQIGFFKTDTSNAADAGALAGSSVISGALLGLGLGNDAMAAEAYVTIGAAILLLSAFTLSPWRLRFWCCIFPGACWPLFSNGASRSRP